MIMTAVLLFKLILAGTTKALLFLAHNAFNNIEFCFYLPQVLSFVQGLMLQACGCHYIGQRTVMRGLEN